MSKNKYLKTITKNGVNMDIDVYDVLVAFQVTNPAIQHAIKKALMPGKRGDKSFQKDINEAVQSLQRAVHLQQAMDLGLVPPLAEGLVHFNVGGAVQGSAGEPPLVGERGPEFVVPFPQPNMNCRCVLKPKRGQAETQDDELLQLRVARDQWEDACHAAQAKYFETVVELDAAIARAQTLEAERDQAIGMVGAQMTTADELERLALGMLADMNLNRPICCNGHMCGCQGATAGDYVAHVLRQRASQLRAGEVLRD